MSGDNEPTIIKGTKVVNWRVFHLVGRTKQKCRQEHYSAWEVRPLSIVGWRNAISEITLPIKYELLLGGNFL
jgi:hypothetical protein